MVLTDGLNFKGKYASTPLEKLLDSKHLSDDWIQLLFNCHIQCKVGMNKKVYENAMKKCQSDDLKQYATLIEENYNKIQSFPRITSMKKL